LVMAGGLKRQYEQMSEDLVLMRYIYIYIYIYIYTYIYIYMNIYMRCLRLLISRSFTSFSLNFLADYVCT
jgi:hypothetical protein